MSAKWAKWKWRLEIWTGEEDPSTSIYVDPDDAQVEVRVGVALQDERTTGIEFTRVRVAE